MDEINFEVKFYDKPDGEKPAKEFLENLEHKIRAKMLRLIDLLEKNGNELRRPYSAHLDDGIFELRATVGSNTTRILYFFFIEHQIILTHGFIKKTDEVPPNEITKAKNYRAEFLNREENKQ